MARSTTRASGAQPPSAAPRTASAATRTSFKVTSHSLRVWSMVGRSLTSSPGASLVTRNSPIPSSGVLLSAQRATTTRTSARWASGTKSLVPEMAQPPATGRGRGGDPAGVPATARLCPGQRSLGLAPGDPGQPLLALGRRARLMDGQAPEEHGGDEGSRHHGAAHLFHEHGEVHKAEAAAPVLLGKHQAQPSLLGHLGPELVGDPLRLRHALAHELRGAFVLEELARGRAQQLLLFVEAEIHG